jgi:RNA-binding protein YhbY
VLVDTESPKKLQLKAARIRGAAISSNMAAAALRGSRGAREGLAERDERDEWEAGGDGGDGGGDGGGEGGGDSGAAQAAGEAALPTRLVQDHSKSLAEGAARRAARAAELAARDPKLVGGVQPTPEERAAAAKGVRRSFARAEALPAGEWARLRDEYLQAPMLVKIGRRGATPQVADAVTMAWRSREVVKLRVHDDKSARKAVLPQLNLVLQQLEELTGGILVDVRGTSIWLYR